MNTDNELPLATTQRMDVAPVDPVSGGISIQQAFQAAATRTLDKESLSVMKELLAMDAEQKFNDAFVALQKDMPVIVAQTVIKNRGKYERFEDVMDKIQPVLSKHGFTVSFDQDFDEKRIITKCHLKRGTHTQTNSFAVRTGPADTDTQSDCKAATTAKRNALLQALNIVIRQDILTEEHDAHIEGDPNAKVTPEQAAELEHRCQMTNSIVPAFLKFANATRFSDIPANKYAVCDQMLRRKEQAGR